MYVNVWGLIVVCCVVVWIVLILQKKWGTGKKTGAWVL